MKIVPELQQPPDGTIFREKPAWRVGEESGETVVCADRDVRLMFASIADQHDRINSIISLGGITAGEGWL